MFTSTLPPPSSGGAGGAWPAALLWFRLGKLGCQSEASTPVITVLDARCVRCTGNLVQAFKCRDVITAE